MTGSVEDTSLDDWRALHALDLDSVFLGCKYAVAEIPRGFGGGSIVNISSISGIIAGHNLAAYNSAKAAVRHLTKSVAFIVRGKKNNVRCNSVHPGALLIHRSSTISFPAEIAMPRWKSWRGKSPWACWAPPRMSAMRLSIWRLMSPGS